MRLTLSKQLYEKWMRLEAEYGSPSVAAGSPEWLTVLRELQEGVAETVPAYGVPEHGVQIAREHAERRRAEGAVYHVVKGEQNVTEQEETPVHRELRDE